MRRFVFVLCALAAIVPPAHAAGLMTGFDAMSAMVMQEGQSSFSGLGFRARLHDDRMVEGLEILPTIEWWRNSSTVSTYDIRTVRKDAAIGADVRYKWTTHGWNPYVGAGYSLHFLATEVDAPNFGLNNAKNSLSKGGLSALAGTVFALTPKIDNFIELKYLHVPDYRQLKFNWGIAINLMPTASAAPTPTPTPQK